MIRYKYYVEILILYNPYFEGGINIEKG